MPARNALSVIPGVLAAVAIVYAIRHTRQSVTRDRVPIRLKVRPILKGRLGRLLAAIQSAGNLAASTVAGLLWTVVSPDVAFWYLVAWMAVAAAGPTFTRHS